MNQSIQKKPNEVKAILDELHHVAIQVENVARAVAWYQEHFRCEISWQDETWALLKFANTSLALVVPGEHPRTWRLAWNRQSAWGRLNHIEMAHVRFTAKTARVMLWSLWIPVVCNQVCY